MAIEYPRNKIIGVGFQKTGTSTIREALKILGYRVGDNKPRLLLPILEGRYEKVFRELSKYDAVEDNPWPLIFERIDEHVPGCRFILTIRDEEAWYQSVSRHIGGLRAPMHEWVYGKGKGLPKGDKAHAIEVYRQHNEKVRAYFRDRPKDLLEIDVTKGEGWEKLCPFLGEPIPDIDFPHFNRTKGERTGISEKSLQKRVKRGRKKVKFFLIRKYIESRGLYSVL